jgi:uncharacterized protein (DUF3820 family)
MADLTDNSTMPFGKYAGEKMANVLPDYLIWIFENNKCSVDVAKYIAENLDCLKQEVAYKNKSK